jgi:hypothetical protein
LSTDCYIWDVIEVQEKIQIPVYLPDDREKRQASAVDCTVDAMTFCKDATRLDSNGNFLLLNYGLIAHLEKNRDTREWRRTNSLVKITRLPAMLLKGAQIEKYIQYNLGDAREDQTAVPTTRKQKTLHDVRRLVPVTLFKCKDYRRGSSCVNTEVQSYLPGKSHKYEGIIRDKHLPIESDQGRKQYLDIFVTFFYSALQIDDQNATVCIEIASELVTHNREMLSESLELALSRSLALNMKETNMPSIIIKLADTFPEVLSSKVIDDYYKKSVAIMKPEIGVKS